MTVNSGVWQGGLWWFVYFSIFSIYFVLPYVYVYEKRYRVVDPRFQRAAIYAVRVEKLDFRVLLALDKLGPPLPSTKVSERESKPSLRYA